MSIKSSESDIYDWRLHPGKHIRAELDKKGWSQRDLAWVLGIHEQTVSILVNEKRNISTQMAVALSQAFDTTPMHWLKLQSAYDLGKVRDRALKDRVNRAEAAIHNRLNEIAFGTKN